MAKSLTVESFWKNFSVQNLPSVKNCCQVYKLEKTIYWKLVHKNKQASWVSILDIFIFILKKFGKSCKSRKLFLFCLCQINHQKDLKYFLASATLARQKRFFQPCENNFNSNLQISIFYPLKTLFGINFSINKYSIQSSITFLPKLHHLQDC